MKSNVKTIMLGLLFLCFCIAVVFLTTYFLKSKQISVDQTLPSLGNKGVTLSPLDYTEEDLNSFFAKLPASGDYVGWYRNWNELADPDFGNASLGPKLAEQNKLKTFVALNVFDQSSGDLYKPLTDDNQKTYINNLKSYVSTYQINFLGLGIEINTLYEQNPDAFSQFVTLYNNSYNAVKEISPNTIVFPVFQLEHMKGLDGGLFGGTNNASKAEWDLLYKFNSDAIGFTTYPSLIYKSVSEVPSNYYKEIAEHTTKPIVFSEIGWFTNSGVAGWNGNEQDQADFIKLLYSQTKNMSVSLYTWSFLYDQQTTTLFDSMGLITRDGKEKLGYQVWVDEK